MNSIRNILLERISFAEKNPEALKEFYKNQSKEDTKKYNEAIKCFQTRLNADIRRLNLKELPFMAVRMKMYALKEISDLKWCWQVCAKYATTYSKEKDSKGRPIRNTFYRCWWAMFNTKKS